MKASDNDSTGSRHQRFLLVEDNFFAADVMSIYLKKNGIDCEVAENGEVGLNMYLRDPMRYDVIFCDLQMPVMDGYEMVKRIRCSGLLTASTIPIVAMSGTISGDSIGQSRFNYFLKKPFELKCIPAVIDEVLNDQAHKCP